MRFYGRTGREKIAKLKERREQLNKKVQQKQGLVHLVRHEAALANIEKNKARREAKERIKWLESSVSHLVKDESWNKGTSKLVHIEIIIRAIIGYKKLESDGIVAFNELAFLVTGSQFEYFSRKDVELRSGYMFYFYRDLNACMEAGYIKKIERKKLYYLTLDGKKRLDAILSHIYKQKGLGNKVVKSK
jgi:hypothetical protein